MCFRAVCVHAVQVQLLDPSKAVLQHEIEQDSQLLHELAHACGVWANELGNLRLQLMLAKQGRFAC